MLRPKSITDSDIYLCLYFSLGTRISTPCFDGIRGHTNYTFFYNESLGNGGKYSIFENPFEVFAAIRDAFRDVINLVRECSSVVKNDTKVSSKFSLV